MIYLVLLAHLWYPPECCSEEHCHPIPCDQITRQGEDFVYDGMHFTGTKVRESQDKNCHVCHNEWKAPFCIFLTPFS